VKRTARCEKLFAMSKTGLVVVLLALTYAVGSAQTPGVQTSAPTVAEILSRMAANTKGLTSYAVPFHIDAHVKKSFISVRVPMDGTRYFKVPDKSALKMTNVPSVAKDFKEIYSWLGTPQTWPSIYDIVLRPTSAFGVFELSATYKPGAKVHPLLDKAADSTVDHILLTVDKQTYDPVRAAWIYRNGSTIVMNITMAAVASYRLPQRESVDMSLPGHHVTALVTFGTYQTNISIPDSTFQGS
jgi:outer membrane lipoprotein-sorting protein